MSVNKYTTAEGLVTLANGSRMWVGTKAAYEASRQAGTMPTDVLVAITDDEVSYDHYSEDETFTGMYWIDGKKIYRKTINCGQLPDSTFNIISTELAASTINNIINIKGVAYKSASVTDTVPLPYPYTTKPISVFTTTNSNNVLVIQIETSSNWTVMDRSYVTIEYTKTND